MKAKHKWTTIPRTVVHDKASYMVSAAAQRLNAPFAVALKDAGFRSWVGGISDSTEWLVGKLGDLYLHETLISHIRRLLDQDFVSQKLHETIPQFKKRVLQVVNHLNSDSFSAPNGEGLPGLARRLRERCSAIVLLKGERLPK